MSFFEFPHTRTYDGDLGWLIKRVSSYDEVISALNEWIETNTPRIEDLEAFKEALESGDLPEGVQEGIYKWCTEHLYEIVKAAIAVVWFEITDDGYFVANIPENWDMITFNTTEWDIILPEQPEYGHLVLTY